VPGRVGIFGEEGPDSLRPFDLPKAPEVLADYFRQMNLSGALRTGEVLPAERVLVEKTGMGRSTAREALRTLAGKTRSWKDRNTTSRLRPSCVPTLGSTRAEPGRCPCRSRAHHRN
jgi:DNA-binding transcriptional MocR family regulator